MKQSNAPASSSKELASGARSIVSIRRAVLLRAAAQGDLQMVQVLIDVGADVNCADDAGFTPLHFACRGQALDVCYVLLEAGARVDAATSLGTTPLHLAISESRGRYDVIALLRSRGASLIQPDVDGVTPAHLALRLGLAPL